MAFRQNRRSIYALLASAGLHASLGTALILIVSHWTPPRRGSDSYTVAVVVPQVEEPSSLDQPLPQDPKDPSVAIDHTGDPTRPASPDFDIEKLRARRDALFPFLTTDLNFLDRINEQVNGVPSAPTLSFGVESTNARHLPPLRLTESELQQTVDRAWSRRSRWTAFTEIAGLLRTHDADTGQVPSVLRTYLDQNLLQLFCDTGTRVPRLWAMLENAADHADFIDFVGAFTQDRPSSLATTELLFLLDKLAQANRDALLLLVNIDPTQELTSPGQELATALQSHYQERLENRRLSSRDIKAWYDMVRLRILSTVIATTPNGYRAADARFLAGAIHFERGDTLEAIRSWREIRQDAGDRYVEAYSRLLDELRWPEGIRPRQIEYVLNSVQSRWRSSSLERLRDFGSACDRY
jgi:hypothetical protein